MAEVVNSEQRITAADLHRITGFSKAYISKLKKEGKLLFTVDADGRERISYGAAMTQLEGSKDYNRDGQRQWGEVQRKGKSVNLPGAVTLPASGTGSAENPHGLPEGNTPAFLLQYGDVKCKDERIGIETQRTRLVREVYDAKLSEMEFREKSGELVAVEGVKEANRRIAGSIRSKFIGLGTKLAPRLKGKTAAEIQVAIEDEINSIFTELYSLGGGKEEE